MKIEFSVEGEKLVIAEIVDVHHDAFEKYLHADDSLPPLMRTGLLHVQFETIHPYLDGNGRIGRLLVTLLLEHWKLLTKPLLYLSLFFKRHRDDYYRRLNAVRVEGDWEGWLDFFLDGVATIADEAVASARKLFALVAADRARVLAREGISAVALRLFELLRRHPVVTVASVMKLVATTKPTAGRAIDMLVAAGVLVSRICALYSRPRRTGLCPRVPQPPERRLDFPLEEVHRLKQADTFDARKPTCAAARPVASVGRAACLAQAIGRASALVRLATASAGAGGRAGALAA